MPGRRAPFNHIFQRFFCPYLAPRQHLNIFVPATPSPVPAAHLCGAKRVVGSHFSEVLSSCPLGYCAHSSYLRLGLLRCEYRAVLLLPAAHFICSPARLRRPRLLFCLLIPHPSLAIAASKRLNKRPLRRQTVDTSPCVAIGAINCLTLFLFSRCICPPHWPNGTKIAQVVLEKPTLFRFSSFSSLILVTNIL